MFSLLTLILGVSVAKGNSENNDVCPYFKYGQCLLVPVHLAYVVVDLHRCRSGWRTCKYYLNMGGGKITEERILRGNGTLEDFVQKVSQISLNSNNAKKRKRKSLETFINDKTKTDKDEKAKYMKLKKLLESLTTTND